MKDGRTACSDVIKKYYDCMIMISYQYNHKVKMAVVTIENKAHLITIDS